MIWYQLSDAHSFLLSGSYVYVYTHAETLKNIILKVRDQNWNIIASKFNNKRSLIGGAKIKKKGDKKR